ncbi:DExH-box splicing factor binding site-domain-containing protein [Epithele typhae]|uniref:DExH-box splicing factor binding site-domain-containing protein n=1 Tax=Epithele typhae TaxID=378194 RepID=UPI0020073680|nr:DExH-box splicing factor binding site-domain-containing protein [Epithele typhae]KAH9941764.1 DExH-box splicing factor binding site-domain-containing protein [Epithele typhae]
MSEKVSFTVRRPTPTSRGESDAEGPTFKVPALPRHLSGSSTPNIPPGRKSPSVRTYSERDSSDEDSGHEDELVTAFDKFGAQRLHEKPKPQGPLVIPALKNRDWRELARKRKQLYVPPSAAATTGADGSVGGLGTRDTINSGLQASGLQFRKRQKVEEDADEPMPDPSEVSTSADDMPKVEETDDQRALRAILASAVDGGDAGIDGPHIDIIPAPSEDDAYKQDVQELPDSATLDDYERVPVSQFGAALLRGMGWKEGQAASRKNKGIVEPWLPASRPALLGIGAKEREVFDDGSKGKKGAKVRPEKRYVPVIKKERSEEGGSSSRQRSPSSKPGSGKPSRSPSPSHRRDSRRDDRDRDDCDRGNRRDDRDQDRRRDEGDRDRDRYRDGDRNYRHEKSGRGDRERDKHRSSEDTRRAHPDRRREHDNDKPRSSRSNDRYR